MKIIENGLVPSRAAGIVWDGKDRKMVSTKAVGCKLFGGSE